MKIDPFSLMVDPIDWQSLKEQPTLTKFREMLAIRKLEHFRALRSVDGSSSDRVKGRISELEELISFLDPNK